MMMKTHIQEIANALPTYAYRGKMCEDESAVGWQWEDLFTAEGKEALIWKIEVFDMFATLIGRSVENPSYEDGLLFAAEVLGPNEPSMPYECPWWSWYGASDMRRRFLESPDGDEFIFDLAIRATNELYEWFAAWPAQEMMIIHNEHQVEKKPPVILPND